MKILIVADGFLPGKKYGGPPVSVDNFCDLMDRYSCYIVARNHDLKEKKPYSGISQGWNVRSNCMVQYLSDESYCIKTFESIIQEVRPDWIYLQSLFQRCVLPCLCLAKKYNIPVLLAPRGELCRGAMRKKYKKVPYIVLLHMLGLVKRVAFQSTSQEETEAIAWWMRAEKERIHRLDNVPTWNGKQIQRQEKRAGEAKLVFLSRIHSKKNLLGALNYLRDIQEKITFDIYGPLEDPLYWKTCQTVIAQLPENVKVNYCGLVDHEKVHEVFGGYDAFLFPTFSENYGHVIVEALLSGCPVIASDQTPWQDLAAYHAGWAIPLDRPEEYTEAIRQVAAWSEIPEAQAKTYITEKLNLPGLKQAYRKVFEV